MERTRGAYCDSGQTATEWGAANPGLQGYVPTAGCAGCHDRLEGATVVGCTAHAGRKFDEAPKAISAND
ncbi:MAG: hypothetical protein RR150_07605, partial [Clostridia bacterium]